jgi:hypothetical protein
MQLRFSVNQAEAFRLAQTGQGIAEAMPSNENSPV